MNISPQYNLHKFRDVCFGYVGSSSGLKNKLRCFSTYLSYEKGKPLFGVIEMNRQTP